MEQEYANKSSGSSTWFLAPTYVVMGDKEATFNWFEKSFDRHEVDMTWLKVEPHLKPFRNDLRYQVLLNPMNFVDCQ